MRRPVLVIATLGAVAACGLITGVGDLTTSPERESEDGAAPRVDGSPAEPDAADAAATIEAGDGAPPGCVVPPVTTNDSGVLTAPRAAGPITVDGRLDDWACAPFTRVDRASSAFVMEVPDAGTPDAFAMEFSVVWEPSALYFAGRVSNAGTAEGDRAVGLFRNDSVELYFDADGVLTGQGGPNDHQYIVDHANRVEQYRPGFPAVPPTMPMAGSFTSAVHKSGGVISFEVRVDAVVALGLPSLAAGAKLGFDCAVNDGDGNAQLTQFLWYRAPTCTCTMSCCCGRASDLPYCNTQRYGMLVLGQ